MIQDISKQEGDIVLSVIEQMVDKSQRFNDAIDSSDIFTMTELFVDLEYEHLMLLSDVVSDPELKIQLMQAAIAVKASAETSRFFPPTK